MPLYLREARCCVNFWFFFIWDLHGDPLLRIQGNGLGGRDVEKTGIVDKRILLQEVATFCGDDVGALLVVGVVEGIRVPSG